MLNDKRHIINKLQKDILQWEGFASSRMPNSAGIGLGPIESAFPNGIFPTGVIHEMLCPVPEQAAATAGVLSGILSSLMQQGGVCFWISLSRRIFPLALAAFNIEPDRLVFVDVKNEKEALWVMEESLKCEGLAAVVAEIGEISFAQSRRLQLAVENSKVTGFVLRTDISKLTTTTCVARWQITSLPGKPEGELPGVSFSRWQVELLRVRNGMPGTWKLEWRNSGFVPVEDDLYYMLEQDNRKVG